MIAYLGLGSNLGDRLGFLLTALGRLDELGPLEASPVYETDPVGGPAGQQRYLNLVARLVTELPPRRLLHAAQAIERDAGRERSVRFGPRTLDIDLLLCDELVLDEPDLVLPHPRLAERAFVLAPLEELEPRAVPEGWRQRLGGDAAIGRAARRVLVPERTAGGAWRARTTGAAEPAPDAPAGA